MWKRFEWADQSARSVDLAAVDPEALAAVPAIGDPDYVSARTGLALAPPGQEGGALRLDDTFGLHPLLAGFHGLYGQGELLVLHAVATPYRDRSHFDGQNVLESGAARPYELVTGWLNRGIARSPALAASREPGIALSANMPLMLRGAASVSSWSPSLLPTPEAGTVTRVAALYGATDPALSKAFGKAREANGVAGSVGERGEPFSVLMGAAARFLSSSDGPRVAMLEMGGWDTHAGQDVTFGALYRNFLALDRGVATLKTALGPTWKDTAVVIVSEFGRTVAMNGTLGTDHGTGSSMFLIGGAVEGGRVVADWPGLAPKSQLDQRDLRPTIDFRSVAAGILRDHLGVEGPRLSEVFPDGPPVRPVDGLLRG